MPPDIGVGGDDEGYARGGNVGPGFDINYTAIRTDPVARRRYSPRHVGYAQGGAVDPMDFVPDDPGRSSFRPGYYDPTNMIGRDTPQVSPMYAGMPDTGYAQGGEVEGGKVDVFPRMREQKPTVNLDARVPDSGTYPVGLRGVGEGPIPTYMAPQNMNALPSKPGVEDNRRFSSPISTDPTIPIRQRIRGYAGGGTVVPQGAPSVGRMAVPALDLNPPRDAVSPGNAQLYADVAALRERTAHPPALNLPQAQPFQMPSFGAPAPSGGGGGGPVPMTGGVQAAPGWADAYRQATTPAGGLGQAYGPAWDTPFGRQFDRWDPRFPGVGMFERGGPVTGYAKGGTVAGQDPGQDFPLDASAGDNSSSGLMGYMRGDNAMDPQELEGVLQQIAQLDPSQGEDAVNLTAIVQAAQSGDMERAASILAGFRKRFDRLNATAQGAAAHGDLEVAARLAAKAHSQVPDGKTINYAVGPDGSVTATVSPTNATFQMSAQQFHDYLVGPNTSFDHILERGLENNLQAAGGQSGRMAAPGVQNPTPTGYANGGPVRGYQEGGEVTAAQDDELRRQAEALAERPQQKTDRTEQPRQIIVAPARGDINTDTVKAVLDYTRNRHGLTEAPAVQTQEGAASPAATDWDQRKEAIKESMKAGAREIFPQRDVAAPVGRRGGSTPPLTGSGASGVDETGFLPQPTTPAEGVRRATPIPEEQNVPQILRGDRRTVADTGYTQPETPDTPAVLQPRQGQTEQLPPDLRRTDTSGRPIGPAVGQPVPAAAAAEAPQRYDTQGRPIGPSRADIEAESRDLGFERQGRERGVQTASSAGDVITGGKGPYDRRGLSRSQRESRGDYDVRSGGFPVGGGHGRETFPGKYGNRTFDQDGWPTGVPRGGQFTRDGRYYDVNGRTYDVDRRGLPLAQQGQPGWQPPSRGQPRWTGTYPGQGDYPPGAVQGRTPGWQPAPNIRGAAGVPPPPDDMSPAARAARMYPAASMQELRAAHQARLERQGELDQLKREEIATRDTPEARMQREVLRQDAANLRNLTTNEQRQYRTDTQKVMNDDRLSQHLYETMIRQGMTAAAEFFKNYRTKALLNPKYEPDDNELGASLLARRLMGGQTNLPPAPTPNTPPPPPLQRPGQGQAPAPTPTSASPLRQAPAQGTAPTSPMLRQAPTLPLPAVAPPAAAPQTNAGPPATPAGTRKPIGNRMYEFDGQGWKPVQQ